ncbi:hypothetical protein FJT64_021604 [Amphibalanus amphitrite]|uniref:Uncharacterized protein n=1 Tax=Amphibalanus amphitrite TaxID=1232801 RepID=A0A6A4WHQ1_AMPAM|nr:hypothetical protein FJT64_021604 [Amphibalanus amphitrite]
MADTTTEWCGIRLYLSNSALKSSSPAPTLDIHNFYRPPIRPGEEDQRSDYFDPSALPTNPDSLLLGDWNAHHPAWDRHCMEENPPADPSEDRAPSPAAADAPDSPGVVRRSGGGPSGARPVSAGLSALAASIEHQLGSSARRRSGGPAGGVALFGAAGPAARLPPSPPVSPTGHPPAREAGSPPESPSQSPVRSPAAAAAGVPPPEVVRRRPEPKRRTRPASVPTGRPEVSSPPPTHTAADLGPADPLDTLPSLTKERPRGPVKRRPSRKKPGSSRLSLPPESSQFQSVTSHAPADEPPEDRPAPSAAAGAVRRPPAGGQRLPGLINAQLRGRLARRTGSDGTDGTDGGGGPPLLPETPVRTAASAAARPAVPPPAEDSDDDDLFGSSRNAPRPASLKEEGWERAAAAAAAGRAQPPARTSASPSVTGSGRARAAPAVPKTARAPPAADSLFSDDDDDADLFSSAKTAPAARAPVRAGARLFSDSEEDEVTPTQAARHADHPNRTGAVSAAAPASHGVSAEPAKPQLKPATFDPLSGLLGD